MDASTEVAGTALQAVVNGGVSKPEAGHVAEFERLMQEGKADLQDVDHYVNGGVPPSQWLSESVQRMGNEISKNFHSSVEGAAAKMEALDPSDPMMFPRLLQIQTSIQGALFQLQFTTGLVKQANNGINTLFRLQG